MPRTKATSRKPPPSSHAKAQNFANDDAKTDYEYDFDDFGDEAAGAGFEAEKDYSAMKQKLNDEGEDKELPYMLFDFRGGRNRWPEKAELVSPEEADAAIQKKKDSVAKESAKNTNVNTSSVSGGPQPKDKDRKKMEGFGGGDNNNYDVYPGPYMGGMDDSSDDSDDEIGVFTDDQGVEHRIKPGAPLKDENESIAPTQANFETLKDGSTALVMDAGWRLKLDLNDMTKGGDAKKEERKKEAAKKEKEAAKRKKRAEKRAAAGGWGSYGGYGTGGGGGDSKYGKYYKDTLGEWTVTMDIKLGGEPPREGVSLLHTALIHAEETKGRTKLKQTEGEAVVNCDGGVGQLGTFGDVSKARVIAGQWHRVVISVKVANSEKTKGELRTWVDTKPGCVLKSEAVVSGGRFELDLDALFLFSSNDPMMMPGGVAVRTVRVQQGFATDKTVKEGRAKDKVFSMQEEERKRKVDEQRRGLSLAELFAKPRPVWSTPALVATFGDAFIEGTPFEGSSCLAWSFTVLNHAFQSMLRSDLADTYLVGLDSKARGTVSDVMHVLNKSAAMFKHMARLLKNPNTAQLMGFLRKIKKAVGKVTVGETLLLPAIIEGTELLLLMVRKSEKYFDLVVVATDPSLPLQHHAVNAAKGGPSIHFRTCLVVGDIDKKSMLCDVFWSALYNLTARSAAKDTTGDMKRFYELLIPFITGKPLEQTLIDVETKDADGTSAKEAGSVGPWRLPQKSSTSYVKCIFEALNFLLTARGLSQIATDQVQLSLMAQLIDYVSNDLMFLAPDENGRRVCEMALSSFSDATVKLSEAHEQNILRLKASNPECFSEEEKKDAKEALENAVKASDMFKAKVPEATRHRVLTLASDLLACAEDEEDLPAPLELAGAADEKKCFDEADPAAMQFKDHLCWDVEDNIPDPGQAVTLRKYDPVDLLQIPEKANTREEAIDALRLCDRQCTKIFNQTHCMKNPKHLIVTIIEHLFTQVLDVPKPRAVLKQDAKREARAAAAAARRTDREKKEAAVKAERGAKWMEFKSGRKEKDKSSADGAVKKTASESATSQAAENTTGNAGTDEKSSVDADFDNESAMLERSAGEQAEFEATNSECYWDQPINYELQVEILLTLNRLQEAFSASAMSIQLNRSFDAVCTVVPGVIMAIADAVLRRLAVDRPSEFSGILMGCTVDGRQLGIAGFGTSVSTFAEQTETMEIHYPELSIARTAVLDYFQSPHQKRLEKIFDWESNFVLAPTRSLVKMLRHLCRAIAFADPKPHMLLCDRYPEMSLLMKNYPELRAYRDIGMWWKWFLNADVTVFPNYSDPKAPRDISDINRLQAQLKWDWNNEEKGYQVTIMDGGHICRCRPDPKKTDPVTGRIIPPEKLPRHRYPSTATPSFHLKGKPTVKTEDDVIYRPNLPSFDTGEGQIINQRDSELLFSYLTVPYIRLPLVLAFFSHDDRVHKLQSEALKDILDSVAFEPGKYLVLGDTGVYPAMVPTQHPGLLSSAYGLMMNELHRSPPNVLEPTVSLITGALALDTGAVCDVGGTDFNTGVDIILYVTRFAARVDNYISFLVDHHRGLHRCIDARLREIEIDSDTLITLLEGQANIRRKLHDEVAPLLEEYLLKLDKETSGNPHDERLIDRNSRLACDLHAHRLLLYRNLQQTEMTSLSAKVLIGSFVYLTTRHTWNKSARRQGKLLLPETELYELLTVVRRRLITWPTFKKQTQLDDVLQTALQVSSSTTGSLRASAAIVDAANRWSIIAGPHSVGRFAVASTRTVVTTEKEEGDKKDDEPPSKALQLERHLSDEIVGSVADTGLLGVEMDLQIGQMTLRSKHLQALESNIANHPDVKHLFGDSTMQASLLERAEHRSRLRLVGLGHELEYWPNTHVDLPPLADQWEREYDPAELGEDEIWISKLFEPVRKNFFDGPNPPPMQFMMPERAISKTAEVAMLIGLHQALGGPFKIIMLFRRLKCLHVYECVSQGRQWWYTLHMTTDARYTQRELQPSFGDRQSPFPKWWEYGAGSPYPRGLIGGIMNDVVGVSQNPQSSVLIKRDASDPRNLSGGIETFVPPRLMLGVVPQSLLDDYDFFQDESTEPSTLQPWCGRPGYKKLRGYPRSEKEDTVIFVEFQPIGDWEEVLASVNPIPETSNSLSSASSSGAMTSAANDRHRLIEVTGLPGRSVRIMRRRKAVVVAEMAAIKAVASELERLHLLIPPSKKKVKQAIKDETKKSYSVGDVLEFDTDGTGTKWVNAEILKVHTDGETYDIEPTESWVGRQLRVPSTFLRRQGSVAVKEGLGVWVYDGLSDSEDEDWRDDDDDEDEDKDKNKKDDSSKKAVCFAHLDRLGPLLALTGWDEGICISILRKVAAVGGAKPFTSVDKLIAVVQIEVDAHFKDLVAKNQEALLDKNSCSAGAIGEDLELLNMMGAPRRSRLHSLLKTLVRVENLGFILAWTESTRNKLSQAGMEYATAFGAPPIKYVELPRLKLAFSCRADFKGDLRLYSLDHSDLFISNVRLPAVNEMLRGIPHSLVLSNLKGELQVLVPVISPPRPRVGSQPFTTHIVLDRNNEAWSKGLSSRYYMYPVHVSTSFLLTKGLNAALYLMLLRLLHRDYDDVYRLSDSVATDTALNTEGNGIFKALGFANNDGHPDAHACRLKISLVVTDSGAELPWDLTVEFAKYIIKLDQIATTCVLSEEEELQLLETDKMVYDENHIDYDFMTHTPYYITLVKNRLHSLRAVLGEGGSGGILTVGSGQEGGDTGPKAQDCDVFHPPREIGSQWCYYQDNTALGQVYSKTHEIETPADWQAALDGPTLPSHDSSFGKWVALKNCINLMSAAERDEIVTKLLKEGEVKQEKDGGPLLHEDILDSFDLSDVDTHPVLERINNSSLGLQGWFKHEHGITGGQPKGGFLTVIVFQVLWDPDCTKVIPLIEELAPSFPAAKFCLLRADRVGVDSIARDCKVLSFPTVLVMRGHKELKRVEGTDRVVGRLVEVLKDHVTPDDTDVASALVSYEVEQSGEVEEEEEEEELQWTWDPEYASESVKVVNYGTVIALVKEDEEEGGEPGKWQYKGRSGASNDNWEEFDMTLSMMLERDYRSGRFFLERSMTAIGQDDGASVRMGDVKITHDMVTGMYVTFSTNPYQEFECRRKGPRYQVEGDEKFTTEAQKLSDKYEKQWKENMKARKLEQAQENVGKDLEGVRGTNSFFEESGVYRWTCKWNHEPARAGGGDAVGICSDVAEYFGPLAFPVLGHRGGHSLGLYADGQLVFDHKCIATLTGPPRKDVSAEDNKANTLGAGSDDEGEGGSDVILPRCYNKHPWQEMKTSGVYCQRCYSSYGEMPYFCGFCNDGFCQSCYDREFKKLNPDKDDKKKKKDDDDDEDDDEEPDEDEPEEEEADQAQQEEEFRAKAKELGKTDEEIEKVITDEKEGKEEGFEIDFVALLTRFKPKKIRLESFLPPEPVVEKAALFGKGSRVTMILDTGTEGGTLSFEVDGVALEAKDGTKSLNKIFERMGCSQIFPALCLCPFDALPPMPECEPPENTEASKKKTSSKLDDDEADAKEAEREKKRIDARETADLARKCRRPFDEINKLEPPQRAQLASMVDRLLRQRVPHIQLIIGDDEEAAVNKAKAEADELEKAEKAEKEKEEKEKAGGDGAAEGGAAAPPVAPPQNEEEAQAAAATLAAAGEAAGVPEAADEAGEEPMDRICWMYETPEGWIPYSRELSNTIEEALRSGRSECTANLGVELMTIKMTKGTDGKGPSQTSEEGNAQRIRRHVIGPGLQGEWEMMSLRFSPPMSMYGQAALGILEKCWESAEEMNGRTHGLGFLFLYNMMQGSTRVSCISGGSGGYGYGNKGGGRNDGHRLAVLLAQLYADKNKRSLLGSCANVLAQNRHICVRMPKLKDTRKSRQSAVFNGWCDEAEPRSPLAELFSKLVPAMQRLKRQRGALRYPPRPPYPEMPPLPSRRLAIEAVRSVEYVKPSSSASSLSSASAGNAPGFKTSARGRAELGDTSCARRLVDSVTPNEIASLATEVRYNLTYDPKGAMEGLIAPKGPLKCEDGEAFDQLTAACAEADQLLVVAFCATWCGACGQLSPVFRKLSLKIKAACFAKVDVDEADEVSRLFKIKSLPTVLLFRGGGKPSNVVGKIEGGGVGFVPHFLEMLKGIATEKDLELMMMSGKTGPPSAIVCQQISVNADNLQSLAQNPLEELSQYFVSSSRQDRGLPLLSGDCSALDAVGGHEAARTAVASSMLTRMKQDVKAHAEGANKAKTPKVIGLDDACLTDFFNGKEGSEEVIKQARETVSQILVKLTEIRDNDSYAISATVPLLKHAANYVDIDKHAQGSDEHLERVSYQLKRFARQAPLIWMEFLFGSTLSTSGDADVRNLNPYLSQKSLDLVNKLLIITMLKANRVGHANRCIGTAVSLISLVDAALATKLGEARVNAATTMLPKLAQASGDLASGLASQRYFVDKAEKTEQPNNQSNDALAFDPRFLLFEFVWNILLREKQVITVRNFVKTLQGGGSKVKQMIMGAGKTTVVAPLLALMLADGDSLVLSVVPKALLEMSRKQMRETFSTIMSKRIYTLNFDRGTVITPATHRGLENAKKNRGVVVATPTTLKSIQLVYVETIQRLDAARKSGPKDTVLSLSAQLIELKNVLQTFRESVLLLDEVDMVLHPLKSELNFPIGEKFDLDGAEQGERWSLPTHLVDALFFTQCGRATTFESSGLALEILGRLNHEVKQGFEKSSLQRLPHLTLLDTDYYHQKLKPILAEWAFLWLQKQHLHGIDRTEAIQYILEGAVARSDLAMKVNLLDAAVTRCEVALGNESVEPVKTKGHVRALSITNKPDDLDDMDDMPPPPMQLIRHVSHDADKDGHHANDATIERDCLLEARESAENQRRLITEIFSVEKNLEAHLATVKARGIDIAKEVASLEAEVIELEAPRDDSLDNATVIWVSLAFAGQQAGANDDFDDDAGQAGAGKKGANSVHSVVTVLEDAGLTVKRCGDPYEAIERARELFVNKRLRCIIYGGGETSTGCGPSCSKNHRRDGGCMICGMSFGPPYHRQHNCLTAGFKGKRGSWRTSGHRAKKSDTLSLDATEFFTQLTDCEDAFAKLHGVIPASRCGLWGGNSAAKQELRSGLWNLGVCVRETPGDLNDWVDSMPPWENLEEEEEDDFDLDMPPEEGPRMGRQISVGSHRLDECRNRLTALEKEQVMLESSDENNRKAMAVRARGFFDELAASVEQRRVKLEQSSNDILQVLQMEAKDITNSGFAGPRSGRDAALAEAWFISFNNKRNKTIEDNGGKVSELTATEKRRLIRAYRWELGELVGLQQVLLAAKVVALISSPEQIKYLNLTHDWLRTFLPHCMQKVNRVSFGLLSTEECAETLQDDPMVPRSRLALAVPFIGKDVPSKSSEFAHPDITIGLTVMAYRYSGLRANDFNDLIDSLTTDFSHEIGPARERPSSLRFESWVAAAGGKVRGVAQQKVDPNAATGTNKVLAPSDSDEGDLEVVQLKFLQKSNAEQMGKLSDLWVLEPLVLHYYLNKFIFPEHMRTQRLKLSASGQSVGGDMLVRRRVGFSGTPSDLLPREMGACEYETGDDGKMLSTVLDPAVMSHELLGIGWSVEKLLERIATAEPRFHSLIDTGALITGYSNEEVAAELLKRGLPWCDGVVFLDGQDKQQVLVRATGRVTSADQCGVPLERRFAFYDQIHTTGMDVKHVVNATAVITLGKDMVFRDYVQGAYRMRGIGQGQKIHVFVIPEVQELMQRERIAAMKQPLDTDGDGPPHAPNDELAITVGSVAQDKKEEDSSDMLKHIVAWLVVNSMRSEQTQWSMLCIQNISNIYRKTAFDVMMMASKCLTESANAMDVSLDPNSPDPRLQLTPRISLGVFEEDIDFSLEAAVPDPLPFEAKLRGLLEDHDNFIIGSEAHAVGADVLCEVGKFSILDGSENKLETEQEREQEQEQQKEVKARRDQQVEIEKFVDREYSRNEERPTPWPLQALLRPPPVSSKDKKDDGSEDHPFYPLREFALRHQESLEMPSSTYCSKNYFNPNWSGLRRIKNVVMVIEWSPNASDDLRLYTADEQEALSLEMTKTREAALTKAFSMLAAGNQQMDAQQALNMVKATTDQESSLDQLVKLLGNLVKTSDGSGLDLDGLRNLMQTGALHPTHKGRYYVCISLAEAETLRRVLHVRKSKPLVDGGKAQVALRYSPVASPGAESVGDGGIAFDASLGWRVTSSQALVPASTAHGAHMVRRVVNTGATRSESSAAHNSLRFFDGDMHYPNAALQVLVRALQRSNCLERERFFAATVGVRRRMDRKWQETPLASVFTTSDEFAALKQRAQSVFVREALKSKELRRWEAFTSFDSDDNGLLGPAEIYGALRWLGMPGLNADDVIDLLEAGDKNHDGFLNYKEFNDLVNDNNDEDDEDDDEEEEVKDNKDGVKEGDKEEDTIAKVEAYGGDEVREVILRRKREELEKQREDRARREAYAAELDRRIFEEELKASASRAGGANPTKFNLTSNKPVSEEQASKDLEDDASVLLATEYRFTSNSPPLRTVIVGKGAAFTPVLGDVLRRKAAKQPLCCPRGHEITKMGYTDRYSLCRVCKRRGVAHYCPQMYSWASYGTPCQGYVMCDRCVKNHTEDKLRAAADPRKNETCMAAEPGTSLSLMIPTDAVVSEPFAASKNAPQDRIVAAAATAALTGVRLGLSYTISMEILMNLLPPKGQRTALLRFSPPPNAVGRAAKRQHSSIYLSANGEIGGPTGDLDESRRAALSKKALILMAGLKCALKLSKTARDLKESNDKLVAEKAAADAKIAEEKAAAEAKIAEEKAAADAKIAEEKTATDAKLAEEKAANKDGDDAESKEEKKEAEDEETAEEKPEKPEDYEEGDEELEAELEAAEKEAEAKAAADALAAQEAEKKKEELVLQVPGVPTLDSPEGSLAIMARAWHKLSGRSLVKLKPNRWHAVTFVIDGGATPPATSIFIDGNKAPGSLVPKSFNDDMTEEILTLLGLGRRLILFGGGKQAESRGGSIRRLRLSDGTVPKAVILKEHRFDLPAANPLMKRSAIMIQAQFRRILAKNRVKDLVKHEQEMDPDVMAARDLREKRIAKIKKRRARQNKR
jgi:thiol-disulfide isomerase/thioredoxin